MEMFDIRPTGFPMAKDLTTEATIATALTAIAQVSLLHRAALTVSLGVKNTGAVNALDQFVIQAQYRQDGDWLTFLSDTDWQKKVWSVTDTVANLQDLPAGADGACAFSVEGVRAIRILAATVASTTTVTVGITVSEGGGVGNLTPSNQADVDIGDVHLLNAADAQINPAVQGGVGIPQTNLATVSAAEVQIAIPAGTKFIDFLLNQAGYVVANATTGAALATSGVPYQPNLNFRLPCTGCTFLHLKRASSDATLQWNAIA